jgi:type 1 glutamine amidotransferase
MRRTALVLAGALVFPAAGEPAGAESPPPARLLVVTVTKGYRHDSIPDLERVLGELAAESRAFAVDYARTDAELAAKANARALSALDGVVFASTTGDLPLPDAGAFVSWIHDGHAFVGVHSATDTFPGFPAYLDMIGGQFARHGEQARVEVQVRDTQHPATRALGKSLSVFDEIYQFKRFDPARVHVLLALDRHPETGAAGAFPLAWTRAQGRGRVFYTALGHRQDVVEASWFRRHLLGGILWALGRASS